MSDIKCREWHDDNRAKGSCLAHVILGTIATLPLIALAVLTAKPLWIILMIWTVGGPAITVALAVVALSLRNADTTSPRSAPDKGAIHV